MTNERSSKSEAEPDPTEPNPAEPNSSVLFGQERIFFPGRISLLESIVNQLHTEGDVWIHHGFQVPFEDPMMFEDVHDVQYHDSVMIPSILHTLFDKIGGKRTTSIAALSGMKKPDLILVQDPATLNTAALFQGNLWITEILLREASMLYPVPLGRTNAVTDILSDPQLVETSQDDVSIEITGFRTSEGTNLSQIIIPLDSEYRPRIGGTRDPASRLKTPVKLLPEAAELVLMISDAVTSSAKLYLGTVNIRLREDRPAPELPKEVNIICLKIYRRYLDIIELGSRAQPQQGGLQHSSALKFRVYRTEVIKPIKTLAKLLHLDP